MIIVIPCLEAHLLPTESTKASSGTGRELNGNIALVPMVSRYIHDFNAPEDFQISQPGYNALVNYLSHKPETQNKELTQMTGKGNEEENSYLPIQKLTLNSIGSNDTPRKTSKDQRSTKRSYGAQPWLRNRYPGLLALTTGEGKESEEAGLSRLALLDKINGVGTHTRPVLWWISFSKRDTGKGIYRLQPLVFISG